MKLTKNSTGARTVHGLIYGEPLSGKSLAAAKLAASRPMIYFDLENRPNTLIDNLSEEELENINYIPIRDRVSAPIASKLMYSFFQNKPTNFGDQTLQYDKIPPETIVVIDSGTQLSKSCYYDITSGIDLKGGNTEVEFKHYAALEYILDNIGAAIQAAPFSVIYITHTAAVKQTTSKTAKLSPIAGTDNYSKNFPKFFDEVCFFYAENKKYKVVNIKSQTLTAVVGSRSGIDLSQINHQGFYNLEPWLNPQKYEEFKYVEDNSPKTQTSNKKLKL